MGDYTPEELREALRPIASLISKSEKAQAKVAPGTWQHSMLTENLRALRHAFALMNQDADAAEVFAEADVQAALRAFASMIGRSEAAQAKFSPGTSQHTLLRNRLSALRVAEALTRAELGEG